MTSKSKATEVDAYAFIKSELKTLGWDTRNPASHPQGQVYTQNQCLSNPEIKRWLDKKRPESIIKVNEETLWVIEAKSERSKIAEALDEAENYYAKRLNQSQSLKTLFVSGIAGNDTDGYIVINKFLEHGIFKPIALNEKEMTGLLSPEIAKRVMETESAELKDVPIDQAYFLQKADHINEILHIGAININDRARVMAAILLSTLQGDLKDLNASPSVLISDINTRAENALASQGKKEFYEYVRLSLPTSLDNHQKYKGALVKTLKELYGLNIRSAMNSGSDVLGQFYEVFLKYGNWAQKMGIVLTPRHITRFAAEALDVNLQDIILDLCCGTGGFLVAAFDYVKTQAQARTQIEHFKKNNVFGIDQQPQLACLAIVNMIFRGDGKNNIIEGDCFTKWVVGTKKDKDSLPSFPVHYVSKKPEISDLNVVTKVLMNPSFAIEASDTKEYRFVQHALDQMVDGGLLFSVLPMGALYEQGEERTWREQRLIKENTLLSVVTFPYELFYPIEQQTLGVFIKKGIPHPKDQNVLWARATHDGMLKKKNKRLPDSMEPNELGTILPIVQAFVHNPHFPVKSVPEICKATPINFSDTLLELIPEAYVDSKLPTKEELESEVDKLTRETVSYLIRTGRL